MKNNNKLRTVLWPLCFLLMGGLATIFAILILPEPNHFGINETDFDVKTNNTGSNLAALPRENRPNIIFILADDMGYGDLSSYGTSPIRTPNLDQLAADGARFTDFYAPAPLCSPSRAGYLTGRYPVRMGITFPYQPPRTETPLTWTMDHAATLLSNVIAVDMISGENFVEGLPVSEITIPEGLKQAGYTTSIIGKWHLGNFNVDEEHHPYNHGFDHFVGLAGSNDEWPIPLYNGREEIIPDIGLKQEPYTALFTDAAIDFITANKDDPFFLFLSHKDPHQPFYPSKDFAGKSKAGPYGDVVEELDHNIGRIIKTLEDNGLTENTLIIFTSDNGPWYEGSAGGLRGRKGMSFEGGYRVPFLIKYPGKIAPNSVHNTPAMGIDLLPTFFALAGVELPQDRVIDGTSLIQENGTLTPDNNRKKPLFFFNGYDFEAVRAGRYKYIDRNSFYSWPIPVDKPIGLSKVLSPIYEAPDGSYSISKLNTWPRLFDIQVDPSESYDVKIHHPTEVKRLKRIMTTWRKEFYANPQGFAKNK